MVQQDNLYERWLQILERSAVNFCKNDLLFEPFAHYNEDINDFLRANGLPQAEHAEYLSVAGGMERSLNDFIAASPERKPASGAVLWRFIKAVHPDMKNIDRQNKQKEPEDYRKERRFQRNMLGILSGVQLDLSARDKINALDYLNYKYATEEYRSIYKVLGKFNFGEIAGDQEYEKKQTVKVVHDLWNERNKSTFKTKIESAREFLETVARNGQLLEGVEYADGKGDIITIDYHTRADIFKVMKKAEVPFSDECLAYFEGEFTPPANMKPHELLHEVLHGLKTAENRKKRNRIFERSFKLINARLQKASDVDNLTVAQYAEYLFKYVSCNHDNRHIQPDLLENLLLRNAERQNRRLEASYLFKDYMLPQEKKSIDKELVAKVAASYAKSFFCSDYRAEEFNPDFHERMTAMFGRIVKEHHYKKAEVEALCNILKSNPDKAMTDMSRNIMRAYTQPQFTKSSSEREG